MVAPDLNQSGTLKTNGEYDNERKNEYGEKNCVVRSFRHIAESCEEVMT